MSWGSWAEGAADFLAVAQAVVAGFYPPEINQISKR